MDVAVYNAGGKFKALGVELSSKALVYGRIKSYRLWECAQVYVRFE